MRKFPKKEPFKDLDDDYKTTIEAMKDDEIRFKIAQVAMDQDELMKVKSEDQDLAEKSEAVKEASAIYREGTKMNRLRIKYAKQMLESRGKA